MDRDTALQEARSRFEGPIWGLLGQLEQTLSSLAGVRHIDLGDARAIGSVLNAAIAEAASAADLEDHGLHVAYCENGQSNKITGKLRLAGKDHSLSFELHLCGPRGGTSKTSHQFAGYDIEGEPTFPDFEVEAPPDLLFFVACHLSGTGVSIARAFLKFADGIDQRKIEIHRAVPTAATSVVDDAPAEEPTGARLTVKKPRGEDERHGGKTDKRGDAASSSKKT